MAQRPEQSYAKHAKFVPLYHFVLFPLLVLYFLYRGWRVFQTPSVETVVELVFAFLILLVALFARIFALQAQDRVIRLEEQLRLARLLPAELHPRLGDLRRRHWVALRFASDDEVEERVREVLHDPSLTGKDVKAKIRVWRSDHFRL